jgi:hypothetical protein
VAINSFGSATTSAVANVTVYPSPQYSLILDNTDSNVTFTGSWNTNINGFGYYGTNFRSTTSGSNSATATAIYRPIVPADGFYDIYVWHPSVSSASTNAQWSIAYDGGTTNISVSQLGGSGAWILLASELHFLSGSNGVVILSNNTGESTNRSVLADAVRFSSSTPPFVINQPQNQTAVTGSNVIFNVNVTGSTPLSYQWRFNSTNIQNATSNNLTLFQVQPSTAGPYSVVVSNAIAPVTSSNALLTVMPPFPPHFVSPSINSNGLIQLTLSGGVGAAFTVETSSNLVDWLVLTNIMNTSGSAQFLDAVDTNGGTRFYRAHWLPQ